MKNLITANKVKQKHSEKCRVIVVDKNTIVTMAAKEKANELNIEFKNEIQVNKCNTLKPPLEKEKKEASTETEDLIQKVLEEVLKKLSEHD
jgi:ethanolamine utilization cobalamin adenosyltransferase